jgi:tRNA (guanine-N7-)-methyltransferase
MSESFLNIALEADSVGEKLDLGNIFARPGPFHVEIGSGKGTFLLNYAKAHSSINLLGIEWANKYYRYSVDRMERWRMENVRIMRTEAAGFVRDCLADETVSVFHVYFPDPWPKKRHHKRRFINQGNVEQMHRCLVQDGEVRLATDHAEYFEWMCDLFRKVDGNKVLFEELGFQASDAADDGEWVGSNFERKYLKEGRKIYTLALKKMMRFDETQKY